MDGPAVLAGGSIIFFTYIGFDSVSTASEECRNPRRDVPIGIIATLIVCTILYVGVAVVLTGMVHWQSVAGDGAPVVNALKRVSLLPGGHRLHFVRLGRAHRRAGRHDVVHPGLPTGPGARLVRHVARPPAARRLQPHASALPHPGLRHLGRGHPGRHPRRPLRRWHAGRDVEHRHAVRLRAGLRRRHHPALQRPRTAIAASASPSARSSPSSASSSASC